MEDSHVYTPTTKLRIETDILGPYAAKLNFAKGGGSKTVIFKSIPGAPVNDNTQRIRPEKNFGAFHKKKGTALLQDSDGRRQTRLSVVQSRQKEKRFETFMEKRIIPSQPGCSTSSLSEMQIINKNNNEMNILKNSKAGTIGASNNVNNIHNTNAVNSRRDQLLRWKDQKAAATIATQKKGANKLSTQTIGQAIPNKNSVAKPPPPSVPTNIPKRPPTGHLAGSITSKVNNVNKVGGSSGGGERRVTRAMSKAQTTAPYSTGVRPPIVKMKNLSLATEPKVVPLSNNHGKKSAPSSSLSTTSSSTTTTAKSKRGQVTSGVSDQETILIVSTSSIPEGEPLDTNIMDVSTPQKPKPVNVSIGVQAPTPGKNIIKPTSPPPPPKPKAKPKGMQFDEVYIEYNNFFLAAGTALMHETVYLKKIVEVAVDIPEDVLSDIESTLGQAKLLMDSKLPQFGQLLYYYLSKENNPGPILPCDLQGWWDVAAIQVEKVKERFNDLRILEKNGWKKPEPVFPVVSQKVKAPLKSMKNSASSKSSDSSSASDCNALANNSNNNSKKKTKPTQASSALRQFLASKRKNVNQQSEEAVSETQNNVSGSTDETTTFGSTPSKSSNCDSSSDPLKQNPLVSSPLATRKFEGVFFQVSSPLRPSAATNPNVCTPRNKNTSLLRTNASTTPATRRASGSRRSSLVTLAVRKSMGSMFKTGAGGQLTEANCGENKAVEQHQPQEWDPQPMESFRHHPHDPDPDPPPNNTNNHHHHPHSTTSASCFESNDDCLGSNSYHQHGTTEAPAWSPFSYDQISMFNNSLLASELQLLYSDWPKDLLVVDEEKDDEQQQGEENSESKTTTTAQRRQHQHQRPKHKKSSRKEMVGRKNCQKNVPSSSSSSAYVSFLGRPLHSGSDSRSHYCEIFGAQNVMDLHPEFSPFDNTIDIEQSLVEKHLSNGGAGDMMSQESSGGGWGGSNCHNFDRTFDETTTTSTDPSGLQAATQLLELETNERVILLSEEEEDSADGIGSRRRRSATNIFDESQFSPLPRSTQCKVCDIYQSMKSRRKMSKNHTGINISVECTNCGRFTDITPRVETRASNKFSRSHSTSHSHENASE